MGDDPKRPWKDPFQWLFRACLLLMGSAIALNLAMAFLCPILPWLIGTVAFVAVTWIVVSVVRWRRSQW
jgi:hypothetical protein